MGSHYDKFQVLSDADKYNKKLDKKYAVLAKCLVPPDNTAQFIGKTVDTSTHQTRNTIDDALGFCYKDTKKSIEEINKIAIQQAPCVGSIPIEKIQSAIDSASKPRKHSNGKAEGARFCYLSAIAAASEYADTAADFVGRQLDNLLTHEYEVSQQITFMMIVEYAATAVGTHKELFDGVIAVRAKALESGKYTQESWKEPIDVDLLLDAAARHLISYLYVDEIDDESGENHMAHIVANVLMIAQQLRGEQDAN